MPLRPRRGYAAAFPRSLPGSSCPPPREFPATTHDRCAPHPAQIHQVRAGAASRGCHTPVPHVLLSVTLAGPRPSGSTGPSRLCQGCSHPPRHHSGRAALSFTALLRQDQRRRSLTSSRTTAPHGAPTTYGTPATRCAQSGASLRDLMTRMGHDSPAAALIYQHSSRVADEAIAAAVDARLTERKSRPAPKVVGPRGGPDRAAVERR